jgi:FAD/FMN-containing dehydrogenase
MISPILGSGVGRLSGIHGIISDQLLSVRMVTSNDSIVAASVEESADLFWAMRGAGGNFGIVVEAVHQVTDLTAQYVINIDFAFSSNDISTIINYLASFGDNMPAKLSFIIEALYNEALFRGVCLAPESPSPYQESPPSRTNKGTFNPSLPLS